MLVLAGLVLFRQSLKMAGNQLALNLSLHLKVIVQVVDDLLFSKTMVHKEALHFFRELFGRYFSLE